MRGICNFKMLYFSIALILIPLLRKRKNFLPSMPKDRMILGGGGGRMSPAGRPRYSVTQVGDKGRAGFKPGPLRKYNLT